MRKAFIIITSLFVVVSVICVKQHVDISDYRTKINTLEKIKNQNIGSASLEKKKEETYKKSTNAVIPDTYANIAIQYIKTIKSGRSTDLYSDRLNKVKDLLSDKMLDKLSPDMTKQEIESEKEYAKSIDKDQITTTKITDINYSYSAKNDNMFEISVIYTLRTQQKDRNDLQRYLCRMNVEKNSDEYKITNIYEDSALSDGIY